MRPRSATGSTDENHRDAIAAGIPRLGTQQSGLRFQFRLDFHVKPRRSGELRRFPALFVPASRGRALSPACLPKRGPVPGGARGAGGFHARSLYFSTMGYSHENVASREGRVVTKFTTGDSQ